MKTPAIFKSAAIQMLFIWLALFALDAHAGPSNAGVLDNVLQKYQTASSSWGTVMTQHATILFWSLAVMSMVWTFGFMAMRKADIGEFFAEFVRFTIFLGFFFWLLTNGPNFATDIITSMKQMGGQAAGTGPSISPSGVVDIGFEVFFNVLDQSSVWSPVDSACGIIIGAVILVVLALVGVNMLILLVSGWILAYGGVFLLGFGGAKWTSDMAIGYFRAVLNVGLQLMAMVLLIGIGQQFVTDYYNQMNAGISLKDMGVMLVASVVLLALVNKVPPMIGGLSGGHLGAVGHGGFGAGTALGAAAVAGAAIATGGAALAAGAANVAGGAQALMAAFSKASAAEAAGGGSGGMGDMVSAATGASGGDEGGGSSLSSAMGDSGSGSSSPSGSSSSGESPSGSSSSGESPSGSSSSGESPSGSSSSGESPSGSSSSSGQQTQEGQDAGKGLSPGEQPRGGGFLGKAARIAAGTANNLAQGSWDVAKNKASDMKEAAMDRIAQTTGGKIATAIKGSDTQDNGGPTFDGNSLAAGDTSADKASEVDAFVNKKS